MQIMRMRKRLKQIDLKEAGKDDKKI